MKVEISRVLLIVASASLLLYPCTASLAAPTSPPDISCNTAAPTVIRDVAMGQVTEGVAAPVGFMLSYDDDARLALRQPLGAAGSDTVFRAFELASPLDKKSGSTEIAVISFEPIPQKLVDGYTPTDSVLLHIHLDEPDFYLWSRRYFILLACVNNRLSGWAMTSARVSNPHISLFICTPVAIVMYILSMTAVWLSRKKANPLVIKYPSVFGTKPMQWTDFFNPIHLTGDAFNQASVQKSQVLLFSFLVGWLLLSLVVRIGTLVDLSATIVALLGISGIGAATAQIAYQQKTRLSFENWAWLQRRGVLNPPSSATGPRWRDLVLTNRQFDIYKLQTIIFTVVVAIALVTNGAANLSTFTVPTALLGILGLSQVVYVGGIVVRPPAVSDLDDAISKLRLAGETVAAAKTQRTDTGPDGKLLSTLPPGQPIAENAQRQYNDLADTVVAMIESTLEVSADRSKL